MRSPAPSPGRNATSAEQGGPDDRAREEILAHPRDVPRVETRASQDRHASSRARVHALLRAPGAFRALLHAGPASRGHRPRRGMARARQVGKHVAGLVLRRADLQPRQRPPRTSSPRCARCWTGPSSAPTCSPTRRGKSWSACSPAWHPSAGYKVFLLTTGSEATENCIKLAKTWGCRSAGRSAGTS